MLILVIWRKAPMAKQAWSWQPTHLLQQQLEGNPCTEFTDHLTAPSKPTKHYNSLELPLRLTEALEALKAIRSDFV